MKKISLLPLLTLVTAPAFAQSHSVSLMMPRLYTQDYSFENTAIRTGIPNDIGIRYAETFLTLPKLGGAQIAYEGTIVKACSKPAVVINGQNTGYTYTHEYMALGLSSTWSKVLDFGAAVELRHETNSINVTESDHHFSFDTTRYRPWATARIGYTLPTKASFKPFATIEYSLPITTVGASKDSNPELLVMGGLQGPKAALTFTLGTRF